MTPLAMRVDGTVASGLGEGAGFASLPWLVEQMVAKLGYAPYPGTFNLLMHGEDWRLARERMAGAKGVAIAPPAGYCRAKCFGAARPGRAVPGRAAEARHPLRRSAAAAFGGGVSVDGPSPNVRIAGSRQSSTTPRRHGVDRLPT